MRILRLYYLLPPKVGGMEKHIYELSLFQKKTYQTIVIFNYGNKIDNTDIQLFKPIKLYKIRPLFIGITIFYIGVIIKLFFTNIKFDVIHIHGDWSSLLFTKMIKKLTSAKIVVFSMHGQLKNDFTHKTILPQLVKKIDLIFSTGYETAQELERRSGEKVFVQPSGIKEVFFENFERRWDHDDFTVITVANLFPKKNIELVLEIAKELKEYKFWIIGDGNQRNKLEQTIKEQDIKNVDLLGFTTPDKVKAYYQKSDCFLLTSFAEGTPTSALEAMACGLPIVSSNAGGIDHIIQDYKNGFIIHDFDKIQYINKLQLLKSDIELRKIICKNNALLATNYKWSKVAKTITKRTKECLNGKS